MMLKQCLVLALLSALFVLAMAKPDSFLVRDLLECPGTRLQGAWTAKATTYGTRQVAEFHTRYAPQPARFRVASTIPNAGCPSGVVDATARPPICPQAELFENLPTSEMNEDCLYVNVWTSQKAGANAPVIVYIHGGALMLGEANMDYYRPWRLAAESNAVVVTIAYRLGTHGWMALNDLAYFSSEFNAQVSSNWGLYDIIMGLKWVNRNIAAFGGNPNLVTLTGQSSGGTVVLALLQSQFAGTLFHRAWSLSGSPLMNSTSVVASAVNTEIIVANSPCAGESGSALRTCLENMDTFDLAYILPFYNWFPPYSAGLGVAGFPSWAPIITIDGVVVHESFSASFGDGGSLRIPVVLTTMLEEADFCPEYVFIDNTTQEFETLLHNWNWATDVSQSQVDYLLNDLFPASNYQTPMQRFTTMSAQTGPVCGTINLALAADSTFVQGSGFQNPFYHWVFTHRPTAPACIPFACCPWTGYSPRYSHHEFDILVLFNDGLDRQTTLGASNQRLHDTLVDWLFQFARSGRIAPLNKSQRSPGLSYFVNGDGVSNLNRASASNPFAPGCAFWKDIGYDQFMWQN